MDPLQLFDKEHPYNKSEIKRIISGEIYTAVECYDGSAGLCANLSEHFEGTAIPERIDYENMAHRIIAQAYFNAFINARENDLLKSESIADIIVNKNYQNVVMIGLFKPLLKELQQKNINVSVFDFRKKESFLIQPALRKKYLYASDCVVLTATTIFNQSFEKICLQTGNNCDIHVLGPSTPLDKRIFEFKNVKYLHGLKIKNKEAVFTQIQKDKGTRSFIKYCDKVYLESRNP